MQAICLILLLSFSQGSVTIVKNNGDLVVLQEATFYQGDKTGTRNTINYAYRGREESIKVSDIKRISFKETLKKKKGNATYRAILVRKNNTKLEIELQMLRVAGLTPAGKSVSLNLSSVDKISF